VGNDAKWDEYKQLYSNSLGSYCGTFPEDPDSQAMAWLNPWRYALMGWGHDTVGFGL
jgi:hypothetical protein